MFVLFDQGTPVPIRVECCAIPWCSPADESARQTQRAVTLRRNEQPQVRRI
jgi:hypothetical protein